MFRLIPFFLLLSSLAAQTPEDLQEAINAHQSGDYKTAIQGYQDFLTDTVWDLAPQNNTLTGEVKRGGVKQAAISGKRIVEK